MARPVIGSPTPGSTKGEKGKDSPTTLSEPDPATGDVALPAEDEQENILVYDGPRAASIAETPAFRSVFDELSGVQGRPDAALAPFANATGYEAVTSERRLFNYLTQTRQSLMVPIRRVK